MSFFAAAFGFEEEDYVTTRDRLLSHAEVTRTDVFGRNAERCAFRTLSSNGGADLKAGTFVVASVGDLRTEVDQLLKQVHRGGGGERPDSRQCSVSVSPVVGDIRALHRHVQFKDAVIQVASQTNCLEFIDPAQVPENGIVCYEADRTQGPACAIACAAGTAYRNYVMDVDFVTSAAEAQLHPHRGQTAEKQLCTFAKIAELLRHRADGVELLTLRNGYVDASVENLRRLRDIIVGDEGLFADLVTALEVGVQLDTDVVEMSSESRHSVTQVFCSALSIAYSSAPDALALWEPLASAVLSGAYEATVLVAVAQSLRRAIASESPSIAPCTVVLSRVGGGVFGNAPAWIDEAIMRAINCVAARGVPLDVRLSYFAAPDAAARRFITGLSTSLVQPTVDPAIACSIAAALGTSETPGGMRFLCANVLHEEYYERHCKAASRIPAETRLEMMLSFFASTLPSLDLVCLQEFSQPNLGPLFERHFGADFGIVFGAPHSQESCAIMYRRSVIEPVGEQTVKKFASASSKCSVAQVFSVRSTGKKFVAVSTHVPFTMNKAELHGLLGEVASAVPRHDDDSERLPGVVAGDFNAARETFPAEAWRELFPPSIWCDAFEKASFSQENGKRIDFALVSRNTDVGNDEAVKSGGEAFWMFPGRCSDLVQHGAGRRLSRTPFFSDHAALAARIHFW